jgi:hypothetical protein
VASNSVPASVPTDQLHNSVHNPTDMERDPGHNRSESGVCTATVDAKSATSGTIALSGGRKSRMDSGGLRSGSQRPYRSLVAGDSSRAAGEEAGEVDARPGACCEAKAAYVPWTTGGGDSPTPRSGEAEHWDGSACRGDWTDCC